MGKSTQPAAPANTTSQTTSNPWAGAIPYLAGGTPYLTGQFKTADDYGNGIFQESKDYFDSYKTLSPQQSGANTDYSAQLGARADQLQGNQLGNQFINGQYDPSSAMTSGRTAGAQGMSSATAQAAQAQTAQSAYAPDLPANMIQAANSGPTAQAQAAQTNLGQSMASLGGNNPAGAIQQLLSGQPDNPYLMGMHQANINDSLRGYGDAVTSLSQKVLPQLGSQAFASGGYGGSRQGIAEGLAVNELQRNARDLGIAAMDSGNQLFGGAYESAQGRKADAAGMMAGLASQTGQFNAGNQQQTNLANADALNASRQFNASKAQDANQFNAQAQNAMKQFTVGNMQNVNLANMAAQNQGNQFNAGNQQQASQFNAANLQDAWKFNAGQAQNANQFNAGQLQNADQFNSNLDLQRMAARAQNAKTGNEINQTNFGLQDNIFNQLQSIYSAPQMQYQNALNQYINTISPGAALGDSSTTSSQVPMYNNNMSQLLGGASSLAGLLSSFK